MRKFYRSLSLIRLGEILQVSIRLIAELHTADLLFSSKTSVSSVGRTSVLNLLYVLSTTAISLGAGAMLAGYDPNRVFVRYLYYPLVVIGQFFFVCATLSVCSVWNSTAKRFMPLTDDGRPLPPSDLHNNAQANEWGIRHWMHCLKLIAGVEAPVAASLSALTVATMVSYFSPFYVSIAIGIGFLVVSVSFVAAGSRMARLLSISADAIAHRESAMKLNRRCDNTKRISLPMDQGGGRIADRSAPNELRLSYLSQPAEKALRSDSKDGEQVLTAGSIAESSDLPTTRRCSSSSEEAQSDDDITRTESDVPVTRCEEVDDIEASESSEVGASSEIKEEIAPSEQENFEPSRGVDVFPNQLLCISRILELLPSSNRCAMKPTRQVKTSLSAVADQIRTTAHFIIR